MAEMAKVHGSAGNGKFSGELHLCSRMIRKVHLVLLLATWALGQTAIAQDADDYRGGWRTNQGEAHTYELSIRGDKVRGIYCTYCADATTLAFIDGTLGPGGLDFTVTRVKNDGSTASRDHETAKFDHSHLILTSGKSQRTLIKDSRGPDPIPVIVSVL